MTEIKYLTVEALYVILAVAATKGLRTYTYIGIFMHVSMT